MAKKGEIVKEHLCNYCGETNPSMFYGKMKTTCNKCHGQIIETKRKQKRLDAIAYKGGKCECCGYDKYSGALEFHHKDPTKKDPQGLRAFNIKRLFEEVDKCMLLCANCHREEHARLAGWI